LASYQITDVNWTFIWGSDQIQVTGSGTYEIGGGQQRLQLDLKIGDRPPVLFDSGLVAAKSRFPNIVVTISINGERCFDKVFLVNASPVPEAQIHPYNSFRAARSSAVVSPPCQCAPGRDDP
jgi:hypothetical protein